MFKLYACKWNQLGSWTKEGDSPVEHKIHIVTGSTRVASGTRNLA
ncbi:hypothetical protein GCWU000323_01828 [Leptotrichia hofstadii F0254]|uniref:Uncharacterized protein n=1 Tax=Leptotrichia hofstadii F0254 TaxID=634994 RepID=C9MZ33_9FUSO|nr:hypothetical protein GCWU000323_02900 [Leptotrichia hofstadii F0254]EEX73169.1 hypothetical protein GCWU000323_02775 [Leptotrichia hofstadii F0254]EEX73206.1 hypothetical protein GCWU000323_02774 [Leptotrichia hofstadii F0254]EEX74123.1 hypothetical protein GCWU000323_01828 [Leptotrichia hofstadii F0254]